jgi:hypothetical protein
MKLITLIYSKIVKSNDYSVNGEKINSFKEDMKKVDGYWKNNIEKVFEKIAFEKSVMKTYLKYSGVIGKRKTYKQYKKKK